MINLSRQGVEVAFFEDSLKFPGDVLKYLDILSNYSTDSKNVLYR